MFPSSLKSPLRTRRLTRGEWLAVVSVLASVASLFGLGRTIVHLSIVEALIAATIGVAAAISALVDLPPAARFAAWLALALALVAIVAAALAFATFIPCGSRCL